jgi:hypothetical protein
MRRLLEFISLLDEEPDPNFIGPFAEWRKRAGRQNSPRHRCSAGHQRPVEITPGRSQKVFEEVEGEYRVNCGYYELCVRARQLA